MITKPIIVTLVTSLLFCSGCAAKNRWFSRRDYSEMQDPFMQSEAVASADESSDGSGDQSGRARLDGLTADSSDSPQQGIARLPGPKPIQQTGVAAESTARSGQIANASYPMEGDSESGNAARTEAGPESSGIRSYQGPALSDFLGRKRAEASQKSPSTAGGANAPTDSRSAANVTKPTGRAAETPQVSDEAASFGNFLQRKNNSVNTAAQSGNAASQQAAQAVQQTEDSVSDFATWAEQRKSGWSKEGTQAVSNAESAAANDFNAAARQTKQVADDVVLDFNSPDFDTEEVAEPLIKQPGTMQTQQKPMSSSTTAFEKPKRPTPTAEANPFENPFDFTESEPVAAKPRPPANPGASAKSETPRKTLDDSFQMDNGWKPAHVTRP